VKTRLELITFLVLAWAALGLRGVAAESLWSPPLTGQNGDTNGDQGLDVGDGIYLLRYFYGGGPAPGAARLRRGDLRLEERRCQRRLGD